MGKKVVYGFYKGEIDAQFSADPKNDLGANQRLIDLENRIVFNKVEEISEFDYEQHLQSIEYRKCWMVKKGYPIELTFLNDLQDPIRLTSELIAIRQSKDVPEAYMNAPIIRTGRLNGPAVFKGYRLVDDPTFVPPVVPPAVCKHQYGDKSFCTSNALPNSPFCSNHGGCANRVFGDEKSGCFSLWGILPRLGMGNLPFPGMSNGGCFQWGCGCLIPLLLLLLLLPFLLCLFKRDCNMLDKLTHRDSLRDTVEVVKHDTVKVVEKETVTKIDTLRMTDTLNQTQSIPDIITLPNVNFETNKAVLKEGSFPSLDQLAELMKRNKDMTIVIEGHTDSVGNPESNRILSQNRANAIKAYLEKKGIESNRIKAVGLGDTKPATSNKTEEGRMINRRVEVRVENRGENIQIKDEKKGDAK